MGKEKSDHLVQPQQRIEQFAETIAGEGAVGFGFGEGRGEVGVGGFDAAEEIPNCKALFPPSELRENHH